uniref:CCHC-type domain-containing protein n=1 Tax=Heterorhabditis bacteriophora TaxID=37862 RepID=A0A1I7WWS9_HETBA
MTTISTEELDYSWSSDNESSDIDTLNDSSTTLINPHHTTSSDKSKPTNKILLNTTRNKITKNKNKCSFCGKNENSTKCSTFPNPLSKRLLLEARSNCFACFHKHTSNYKCKKLGNPCYNCKEIGHHYVLCPIKDSTREQGQAFRTSEQLHLR